MRQQRRVRRVRRRQRRRCSARRLGQRRHLGGGGPTQLTWSISFCPNPGMTTSESTMLGTYLGSCRWLAAKPPFMSAASSGASGVWHRTKSNGASNLHPSPWMASSRYRTLAHRSSDRPTCSAHRSGSRGKVDGSSMRSRHDFVAGVAAAAAAASGVASSGVVAAAGGSEAAAGAIFGSAACWWTSVPAGARPANAGCGGALARGQDRAVPAGVRCRPGPVAAATSGRRQLVPLSAGAVCCGGLRRGGGVDCSCPVAGWRAGLVHGPDTATSGGHCVAVRRRGARRCPDRFAELDVRAPQEAVLGRSST